MEKSTKVERYKMSITEETIKKYGYVRIWDRPQSAVEGAQIVKEVTEPTEVTVIDEQKDMYGSTVQRAKVRFDRNKEGWVIYSMLTKEGSAAGSTPPKAIRLSAEQKKEGYRVEESGEYVLVWHNKNQIALLHSSPDISRKVQDSIEKRRKELKEVEEKTGWKPGT